MSGIFSIVWPSLTVLMRGTTNKIQIAGGHWAVKWQMLQSSMYDLTKEVSNSICLCNKLEPVLFV